MDEDGYPRQQPCTGAWPGSVVPDSLPPLDMRIAVAQLLLGRGAMQTLCAVSGWRTPCFVWLVPGVMLTQHAP